MMKNIQTGIDQTINIINSLKVFTSENDMYSNVSINELIDNILTSDNKPTNKQEEREKWEKKVII